MDDLRLEFNESFSVVLSNTEADALVVSIAQANTRVMILDNDRKLSNYLLF